MMATGVSLGDRDVGGVDLAIVQRCNARSTAVCGTPAAQGMGLVIGAGTVAGGIEGGEAADSKILQTLPQ